MAFNLVLIAIPIRHIRFEPIYLISLIIVRRHLHSPVLFLAIHVKYRLTLHALLGGFCYLSLVYSAGLFLNNEIKSCQV